MLTAAMELLALAGTPLCAVHSRMFWQRAMSFTSAATLLWSPENAAITISIMSPMMLELMPTKGPGLVISGVGTVAPEAAPPPEDTLWQNQVEVQ